MHKLDIAWISPLPPQATGIAGYSAKLLEALDRTGAVRLQLYSPDTENCPLAAHYPLQPLDALALSAQARAGVGLPVYQLGNNARYHGEIWRLMQQLPGVVVLHDAVLYNLMAAMGQGRLLKALSAQSDGSDPFAAMKSIECRCATAGEGGQRTALEHYPEASRFPLLAELNRCARLVVVHSQAAADILREQGYNGPVEVMPHLILNPVDDAQDTIEHPALKQLQQQREQQQELRIVGLFGFRGGNKQADTLLSALQQLPESLAQNTRLLIVGSGHSADWLSDNPFAANTVHLDYVSDNDFEQAMALTDLVINLRYPSYGETSGVQIHTMVAGKASLVTDTGWFAELPADTCWQLPPDDSRPELLAATIAQLLQNDCQREAMGQRARRWVKTVHHPERVADQLLNILRRARYLNPQPVSQQPGSWVQRYKQQRLAQLAGGSLAITESTPDAASSMKVSFGALLRQQRWLVGLYHRVVQLPVVGAVASRLARRLR